MKPFVRINNLKNGIIDDGDLAFISPERHKQAANTALCQYDIILSKTAYPAASLVQMEQCNTSQDTVAVRTTRSQNFNVCLAVYLNTRFGLLQMKRLFQGNVQMHLSLPDAKTIIIPVPDAGFQVKIRDLFEQSILKREQAKQYYAQAQALLAAELGLGKLDLSENLHSTRRVSEVWKSKRMDAEHFKDKYDRAMVAIEALKPRAIAPLGSLVTTITNGHTPRHHDLSVGEIP